MIECMHDRRNVLVVDDTPENISLLKSVLKNEYAIKVATNGCKAIEIARNSAVDIILLDVMMPDMDGFETCRRLKDDPITRGIPVIFVTALNEVADETKGFVCGGVDYVTKPISAPVVQARIRTHLALYDQNRILENKVRERTAEVVESRLEIIRHLGRAAEFRDNETGMHVIRMSRYSQIIALEYGLPEYDAELILHAAPMHDVGKIGIPDRILLKPGKLNDEEFEIIKTHCEIGSKIISHHNSDLLKTARTIALSHHERWDGRGYPSGLRGTEIPISGRISAVADVFDALTSERPYKRAWSEEEAAEEIQRCSGSHFDPDLVKAFFKRFSEILEVKRYYADDAPLSSDCRGNNPAAG